MALGVLKWIDYTKPVKSQTPHYAPIILLPIELVRRPANKGFAIKLRDEDTLVNITLLEFLKQQFGMDITGLNPPPQDDNGIDVLKVFTIIRRAILEREKWDVIDCAFISNFSFAQFMMWNDIHSHSEEIKQNKIVKSLIDGKLEWDISIPDDIDSDDALLPVDVDASQLHAVKMAANGVSFVLHGPPGTGKSQTITAMIANSLYKGQKVLFVAEKQAALRVVYRNLIKVGLGDFCLQLHSNKAKKHEVLEQFKRSLNISINSANSDYAKELKEIKDSRKALDSYALELHRPQPCGMSVRELIDSYESIPEYDAKIRLSKEYINSLTKDEIDKQRILLDELFATGSAISNIQNNPLSIVKQTEYYQSLRRTVENFFDDYCALLDELCIKANELANNFGMGVPITYSDWENVIVLSHIALGKDCSSAVISNDRLRSIVEAASLIETATKNYEEYKVYFFAKYNESILSADLDLLERKHCEAQKKIIGKQKAIDSVKAELQQHLKASPDFSLIGEIRNDIAKYQQLTAEKDRLISVEQSLWNGKKDVVVQYASAIEDAYQKVADKEKELCEQLIIDIPNDEANWIEGKKHTVGSICDHSSELRDWILYNSAKNKCIKSGLEPLCLLYENGTDPEDIFPIYLKTVYKELIWKIIDESPALNAFSGFSYEERVRQYKNAEERYLQLSKEELYLKLASNLPTGRETPDISQEMTLLRKAISSNGRGLSLRTLFDRIPNILTRLCPCLLMSPMSVAQYLSLGSEKFDLVIFDEASQLPTAQAVGTLARGNNAVIVGDPEQLPPTSFFNSNNVETEDIQLDDLDSILDDCLALGMPNTHLLWHYRSKHESLIAFSNYLSYQGSMFTFPSVNDREKRVRLCTVNGTYKRKAGINEKEGKAVFKEVVRRYNSKLLHDQTMGIVTFNIKQRDYIQDLIDEECKKNSDFDAWVHRGEFDELFVKNLENVQGDERDVILFSIGFGPDENGKIYYNFGPLNRVGGKKRLNVAISRSKQEMIVFSSMTPDMIDVNRSANEGVKQFHDFLEYAATGIISESTETENFHTKGITLQICDALKAAGYKCQKNIGSSNIKVDVAVINPFDEGEYLLGILLDGDSYKKAENTRDRELAQQARLESLGWKTYRIWTMDWWDSKKRETKNLLDFVEKCRSEAELKAANPDAKDNGPESEELVPREVTEEKKKEKKEKEQITPNSSFESLDRFRV